jgi:hypothetical protein
MKSLNRKARAFNICVMEAEPSSVDLAIGMPITWSFTSVAADTVMDPSFAQFHEYSSTKRTTH